MAGTTLGGRNWTERYGVGRILSAIVVLFGIWQIIAPYLLGFAGEQNALWNSVGAGILLVVFAGLSIIGAARWHRWPRIFDGLAALTGLWLAASPFVFQYQQVQPAFWSALIVGVLSFIAAGFAAMKQGSEQVA